jgi:hypothetical protein
MGGAGALKAGPTFSRLWAVGAVGLGLTVLADFAPQIAGPLAALVAIGYLAGAEDAITKFVHGGVAGTSVGAREADTRSAAQAATGEHTAGF